MSPALDERERIRAAMDRIFSGTTTRSNGALTIVALAAEAEIPRNALTQRHLDLKNEFYDKVRSRGGTPDSEVRLREQLAKAKKRQAQDAATIRQLRADVEALVGAVHQSAVENRRLRTQLHQPGARIHELFAQPRPTPPRG